MVLGIIIGIIVTLAIEALVLVTFEAIFANQNISLTTENPTRARTYWGINKYDRYVDYAPKHSQDDGGEEK